MKNEKVFNKTKFIKEFLDKQNNDILEKNIFEVEDAYFFYNAISSQTAQSKAPLSEKFIANKMNWTIISPSQDRGDFYSEKEFGYIELKNSFTNKEEKLNIRQIRLWQEVDYYLCIYIDENNLNDSLFYFLTKKEMTEEVELIGGFTHGTVKANEKNENKEYSITISVKNLKNKNTQRWNEKYLSNFFKKIFFNEVK